MATTTRNQVAEYAGVSTATVSRVMNGVETVDGQLRERVMQAAVNLDYRPSKAASALRRRSTGVILLVHFMRDRGGDEIEIYSEVYVDALLGVQEALKNSHLMLAVHTARSAEELATLVAEHPCDGIIGYDVEDAELAAAMAELPVECVLVSRSRVSSDLPECLLDSRRGGALAAEHLCGLGCRRLLLLGTTGSIPFYIDRQSGFADACRQHGREIREVATGFGVDYGRMVYEEVSEAIRAGEIDGVFGVNSWTLVGFLQAAQEAGVQILRDMTVVGYDHTAVYRALPFPVAAVDANVRQAHRRAAEMLLGRLHGECPVSFAVIDPSIVESNPVAINRPQQTRS